MLFGVVWFNQHQANLHVKESDPISTQKKNRKYHPKRGKGLRERAKKYKMVEFAPPKAGPNISSSQ